MPNDSGVTPVCASAYGGHAKAITSLKAAGANVDTPEINGLTPIYIAVQMKDTKVVNALLEAGANASTVKTPHGTPLELAKKFGYIEIVALLKSHLKQYQNGIITRNVNTVATHSGSRLETKEQSEISGQKLQATLPHSRNTTEFNPRSRTDDNSAHKVVIVHSGSKPQTDEDFQKFSAVINGQDDYWIEQNNHKGLPKGIQALQKAMNAQNYSLGALIAEAKKWRKPTFLYKPEPCLQPYIKSF
jgi:ankyrin repeat protein